MVNHQDGSIGGANQGGSIGGANQGGFIDGANEGQVSTFTTTVESMLNEIRIHPQDISLKKIMETIKITMSALIVFSMGVFLSVFLCVC